MLFRSNWKKILKREGIPIDDNLGKNVERLINKLKEAVLEEKIMSGIDMYNYVGTNNMEYRNSDFDDIKEGEPIKEMPKLPVNIGSFARIEDTKETPIEKGFMLNIYSEEAMNDGRILNSSGDDKDLSMKILDTGYNSYNFAEDINEDISMQSDSQSFNLEPKVSSNSKLE